MKINKYDITAANVWAYIQGNARMLSDNLGYDILQSPPHIQEQVMWRFVIANSECIDLGECINCHCSVPGKFYSDKGCEGNCYPAIMDKSTWANFKQLTARRKIDIFADSFDWDVILSEIPYIDATHYCSLFGFNKSTVELGEFAAGAVLTHDFELFNPDIESLVINTIQPNCNCCVVQFPASIDHNQYGLIKCIINTIGKQSVNHELWLTIRYNEINRINYKINFTIL